MNKELLERIEGRRSELLIKLMETNREREKAKEEYEKELMATSAGKFFIKKDENSFVAISVYAQKGEILFKAVTGNKTKINISHPERFHSNLIEGYEECSKDLYLALEVVAMYSIDLLRGEFLNLTNKSEQELRQTTNHYVGLINDLYGNPHG